MLKFPALDLATGMTLGAAIVQLHGVYAQTAPPVSALRQAAPGSVPHRQALMDADLIGGGVALFVGGVGAVLVRSPWPFVIVLGGFLLLSLAHHAILASPPTEG